MQSRYSLWLLSFYPSQITDIKRFELILILTFRSNNKEKFGCAEQVLDTSIFLPPHPFVSFLDLGFILFTRILTKINMVYYAYRPHEMLTP